MKQLKMGSVILLLVGTVFALNGCLAMAAGYGIAKASEGDDVYVCQNAANASSKGELQTMLASPDSAEYVDRSGEKVEIESKSKVDVGDQTRNVIYVQSKDFEDRRYWVPFSAVCRSD